jgi:hypothetical protein
MGGAGRGLARCIWARRKVNLRKKLNKVNLWKKLKKLPYESFEKQFRLGCVRQGFDPFDDALLGGHEPKCKRLLTGQFKGAERGWPSCVQ